MQFVAKYGERFLKKLPYKIRANAGAIIWFGSVLGRLETRDWKTRDHLTGVENARPVAMERQSYKKSKTEIVVIVHY